MSLPQSTRRKVRAGAKKGVTVEIKGKEAVPDFARLMLETGVRDGFVTREASYFENMLDNLGEHARLYMAYYEGQAIAGTLAIWLRRQGVVSLRRILQRAPEPDAQLYASVEHDRVGRGKGLPRSMTSVACPGRAQARINPLYGLYKFKLGFGGVLCGVRRRDGYGARVSR